MAICKRNGKWIPQVYEGMSNGKRIYKYGKAHTHKADALLEELELKKNVIETSHTITKKSSFSCLADTWNIIRKSNVATRTWKDGDYIIKKCLTPRFGTTDVSKIDALDIKQFVADLNEKYSPETVIKRVNILKQILDLACECHMIRINPCIGVKKPKIVTKKRETWSYEEISKFLSLDDTKRQTCYTAFLIIFTTGMRPGEVCGLRWCDWHKDHLTPTFGIDKERNITNLKNEKAHDNVYISDIVQAQLKSLRIAQKALYFANGRQFSTDCFINVIPQNMRVIEPNYLSRQFSRIVKRNNLKNIRLYDARHSLGTNMMRDEVNPKKVAEIMRHTTVKTTLDIYSHVSEDEMKNVIDEYSNNIKIN